MQIDDTANSANRTFRILTKKRLNAVSITASENPTKE